MKIFLILPAAMLVAACNQGDEERADAPANPEEASAVTAADGGPPQGLYKAVDSDGVVLIEELRADGTYTFKDEAGNVLEEGVYEQKSAASLCFTANAQGAAEKCYAETVGDDGVWRSTDPDSGVAVMIERIEP